MSNETDNKTDIDYEIYEFIKKMDRRHERTGQSYLTSVSPSIPTYTGGFLPNCPDKDRGNDLGWERGAKKTNMEMQKTARRHRIQNKIATTVLIILLLLCALIYLAAAIRYGAG